MLSTLAAGTLAATAWSTLAAARAQAVQVAPAAVLALSPGGTGEPGACPSLPPGHPPIGSLLPPGHPPIGGAPEDEPTALPPGHPPIGPRGSTPHALPPAGGDRGRALFEEPALRDI
ncbi:hypothetical protein [Anaeromyxobacter paludicola]|uniref:Uncharacterized protein n=1 Tax=Anaeromyxobacter paludicola TaxID=2918171 RepID=A0ABM7X7S1_9BACT|nr:hypothetical protein [Anaeromyxobacter paludicola]BDG07883.1 hypothetical protein AMPC_09960 [Anaeromyxobacter paludicola]